MEYLGVLDSVSLFTCNFGVHLDARSGMDCACNVHIEPFVSSAETGVRKFNRSKTPETKKPKKKKDKKDAD